MSSWPRKTDRLRRSFKKIFFFQDDLTRDPPNFFEFVIGAWFLMFRRLFLILLGLMIIGSVGVMLSADGELGADWWAKVFLICVLAPAIVSLILPLGLAPYLYFTKVKHDDSPYIPFTEETKEAHVVEKSKQGAPDTSNSD